MDTRFDLDELARDVAIALRSELSKSAKALIINSACWCWSGATGKYLGCRFWSKAALKQLAVRGPGRWGDWCHHEHVMPRRVVVDLVMKLVAPSPERVRELLDQCAIGCVVTIVEDRTLGRAFKQSMPPGFFDPNNPQYQDHWARYKAAEIEVVGPLKWADGQPLT